MWYIAYPTNVVYHSHCLHYNLQLLRLSFCWSVVCWNLCSGGSSLQYLGGGGARAYNGGLEAKPPAGSRGKTPGHGVMEGGKAHLKLKHFWFLDVQWKRQICPLFNIWQHTNKIFVLSLQKEYSLSAHDAAVCIVLKIDRFRSPTWTYNCRLVVSHSRDSRKGRRQTN